MIGFSWLYSAISWFFILAWPLALRLHLGQPYVGLLLVLNVCIALFVIDRCSSKELNFIHGLDIIAGSSMSGCMNVTILYLPALLLLQYLVALYHSVVSLSRGREYSREKWRAIVEWFYQRRLNAPLNPMTHMAPPDPESFEINLEDSQSLLDAASLWEMNGEWERAIALYRLAAEKLKGQQDGVYAENCIKRIQEKIARVEGQ